MSRSASTGPETQSRFAPASAAVRQTLYCPATWTSFVVVALGFTVNANGYKGIGKPKGARTVSKSADRKSCSLRSLRATAAPFGGRSRSPTCSRKRSHGAVIFADCWRRWPLPGRNQYPYRATISQSPAADDYLPTKRHWAHLASAKRQCRGAPPRGQKSVAPEDEHRTVPHAQKKIPSAKMLKALTRQQRLFS
jgi:hypothetical protein